MINFKHTLTASGAKDKLAKFEQDIIKLGHKNRHPGDTSGDHIVLGPHANSKLSKDEYYFLIGFPNRRDFEFNLDIPQEYETALAIAAIVDDDEPHVGEYIIGVQSSYLPQGRISIITEIREVRGTRTEISFKGCGLPLCTDLEFVRKCTAEEIISHFKNKYMKKLIKYKVIKPCAYVNSYGDSDKLIPGTTFEPGSLISEHLSSMVENEEFFEKVYEEDKKVITIGSQNDEVTITKGENSVRIGSRGTASIEDITNVIDKVYSSMGTIMGHYVHIEIDRDKRMILIGCKAENHLFSINELQAVIDEHHIMNMNS